MPRKIQEPGSCPQKARKRNAAQKRDNYARMQKLMLRGYTFRQVATILGLSHTQVRADWQKVLDEMVKEQEADTKRLIAAKLAQLQDTRRHAWEGWVRSKKDIMKEVKEEAPEQECFKCGGEGKNEKGKTCGFCKGKGIRGGVNKITTTRQGRIPDANFLRVVLDCLTQERELLGITPATQVNIGFDWDTLAKGIPANGQVPDRIEEELQKAMALLSPGQQVITVLPSTSSPGTNGSNGHSTQEKRPGTPGVPGK